MDLGPARLGGLIAVMFPVFERSVADAKPLRKLFLCHTVGQPLIPQQLAQRGRIAPYGLDHQMAKWAQKGPLPPFS